MLSKRRLSKKTIFQLPLEETRRGILYEKRALETKLRQPKPAQTHTLRVHFEKLVVEGEARDLAEAVCDIAESIENGRHEKELSKRLIGELRAIAKKNRQRCERIRREKEVAEKVKKLRIDHGFSLAPPVERRVKNKARNAHYVAAAELKMSPSTVYKYWCNSLPRD
jgi:hypothetical protein